MPKHWTACEPDLELEPLEDRDRRVLQRVAEGDIDSFGVLVERHEQRLVRLCFRLLHDREEARDAAQEIFLKAFKSAGNFQPRGQVYTWLYRIAVNHCLNRLRRRKIVRFFSFAELSGSEEEEISFDPIDEAPDPERRFEARQRFRCTRELIDTLPAGQQTVLVLAKFEGLSYREIAEVMQITESAVESRLFRAMRRLNEAQEKDG